MKIFNQFLEKENTPIIKEEKHMYLALPWFGTGVYVCINPDGVVKTSIIMKDGRSLI